MNKINIFSHIFPSPYKDKLIEAAPKGSDIVNNVLSNSALYDLDDRFRVLDRFGDIKEVLSIAAPGIGEIAGPEKAAELIKIANDGLAALIEKYNDRFVGGIASLALNNLDATMEEIDRSINQLNLSGIEMHTPANGKPLDAPEFMPIFEKMAELDRPIWLHPRRDADYADYKTEDGSKYRVFSVIGWPYETSVAMIRIVFSGILEKYPGLKIITHHCGGMIPYFAERLRGSYERLMSGIEGNSLRDKLSRPHMEYFKMFYNDTAINGNTSALMCAYDFFGPDKLLFGTDMPFDTENGERNLRQVSTAIDGMAISDKEKRMIYESNAKKMLNML